MIQTVKVFNSTKNLKGEFSFGVPVKCVGVGYMKKRGDCERGVILDINQMKILNPYIICVVSYHLKMCRSLLQHGNKSKMFNQNPLDTPSTLILLVVLVGHPDKCHKVHPDQCFFPCDPLPSDSEETRTQHHHPFSQSTREGTPGTQPQHVGIASLLEWVVGNNRSLIGHLPVTYRSLVAYIR